MIILPRFNDMILIEKREALGYSETMSPVEIDAIISRASTLDYKGLNGDAWECLFAIFWAFGKRISEIVELLVTDINVRGNFLTVSFNIRKKRGGERPRRTKRLTLENKYAQIIKQYWESIKDREKYMFPYEHSKDGYINPRYVWDFIKLMDFKQPIWTHLFRHTLATELAQNEVSAFEMKTWFDWENIATADNYVSAAGVSTKKVSGRMW